MYVFCGNSILTGEAEKLTINLNKKFSLIHQTWLSFHNFRYLISSHWIRKILEKREIFSSRNFTLILFSSSTRVNFDDHFRTRYNYNWREGSPEINIWNHSSSLGHVNALDTGTWRLCWELDMIWCDVTWCYMYIYVHIYTYTNPS